MGGYLGTGIGFGGGALVGFLIALPLGYNVPLFSRSAPSAGDYAILLSGALGASLFVPLCVSAVGALWQAKGKLDGAYIGAFIGTALGVGVIVAALFMNPMLAAPWRTCRSWLR